MSDIFISYKREDQPIARKLADALEGEGWTVWWDPKLRAGERFNDVIEKALKESKCVVVIWSKRSVSSQYVKHEANYALKRNKLVPVMIEEIELPFRFEDLDTPSLLGWDGSRDARDFCKLVEDIAAIVGSPVNDAKRKADEEKETNRAPQEARAQSTAEKERLRQQERRWSEAEARRKPEEDNRKRIEEERNRAEQEKERRHPGTVFRDKLKGGSQGPEMVVIPAGTFRMGDINGDGDLSEWPVHHVRIMRSFAMGRYEVTFEEYDQFASATGRELPNDEGWGRGRLPVIYASWDDAVDYAEWLSQQTGKCYRLPTEAEWEYAARAGTETAYWWGNEMKPGLANSNDRGTKWSGKQTAPVGTFKPNSFGLYDTAGNVFEWLQDCWHDNYDGAPENGTARKVEGGGYCNRRVIRGGCWYNTPEFLRSSSWFKYLADNRDGRWLPSRSGS